MVPYPKWGLHMPFSDNVAGTDDFTVDLRSGNEVEIPNDSYGVPQAPVCRQVETVKCAEIPVKKCQDFPRQQCEKVPVQKSVQIPRLECKTIPQYSCTKVKKATPHKVCQPISVPQCINVVRHTPR